MIYLEVPLILQLTAGIIGLELACFAILLASRNLFRWTSAGFWAWSAFLIYFCLSPFAVSMNEYSAYKAQLLLALTGGGDHALWVLFLVLAGIAAFFVAYLRTPFKPVTWNLPAGPFQINLPALMILFVFVAFGIYSLLVFRAGLFSMGGEKLIVGGRFTGDITGYQNGGYAFLFVPIVSLLLSNKKRMQALGGVSALLFLFLSLPHAWSRYVTVSFLLALSLVAVVKRSKPWPSLVWIAGILLAAVLYQMRGHNDWHYGQINREVISLADSLPQRANQILSSSDTAMLQTWYVSSYLTDRWAGVDYGLPLLNYSLTGWIPSRFFPNKYFMIDWLQTQRSFTYPLIFDRILYGAKSSLLGSFYDHGGWVGVLLGGIVLGFLSRRLDGMLAEDTSNLVKSTAITWLSVLWMVWASNTTWGLMAIGALAMPAIAVWIFLPKRSRKHENASLGTPDLRPGQVYLVKE